MITKTNFCSFLKNFPPFFLIYSPFHKTLPSSSFQMHWISVRFYEMGDSSIILKNYVREEDKIMYMLFFLKFSFCVVGVVVTRDDVWVVVKAP